jgi:NAD(P)H-hydrate epimerase
MRDVVTIEQMRKLEHEANNKGILYSDMMQNAGKAIALVVQSLLESNPDSTGNVLILVGAGNNGGDGLEAGRFLKQNTPAKITSYLAQPRSEDDPELQAAISSGVSILLAERDQGLNTLKSLVRDADVIVDALIGIGARLPLRDNLRQLLTTVSQRLLAFPTEAPILIHAPAHPGRSSYDHKFIVAVDCPSGLDCDTGKVDLATLYADKTVTFAAAKFGHLIFPGAEATGELIIADIGIPGLADPSFQIATGESVTTQLPDRSANAHKGSYGRTLIIAGSDSYRGAAWLAGMAAYRIGAGLVQMAVPDLVRNSLAGMLPEAIWLPLPDSHDCITHTALPVLQNAVQISNTVLIGPGLGQHQSTFKFIESLHQQLPRFDSRQIHWVIDADGLNLLGKIDHWWSSLGANTILTPHVGEMARLTGLTVADIVNDRFTIAREFSAQWNCVVVLKGAYTVVARPTGRAEIMPFANDALATAGTGDILAGCIAGLLSQGATPFDAACAGAYVHGLAGDIAAKYQPSRTVTARDILTKLTESIQQVEAVSNRKYTHASFAEG